MAEPQMTPEQFKAMVKGRSDEELLEGAKGNENALLDGTQAFMARKLRIAGDLMFSQNLNNWFKRI
jgi:putative sterol carrier protein